VMCDVTCEMQHAGNTERPKSEEPREAWTVKCGMKSAPCDVGTVQHVAWMQGVTWTV